MLRALDLLGQINRVRGSCSGSGSSSALSEPPTTTRTSPYCTPPRSQASRLVPNAHHPSDYDESSTAPPRRSKRLSQNQSDYTKPASSPSHLGVNEKSLTEYPPTPTSLTKPKALVKRKQKSKLAVAGKVTNNLDPHDLIKTDTKRSRKRKSSPVITSVQTGAVGKIRLIQETVRDDPWKLLVATCLLNVTSGRASRPIYYELLRRWPDPELMSNASIPELTELLYPIGLFNQRAQTLVKFSQQYLSLNWPEIVRDRHAGVGDREMLLDVNVFHGAGRYASDSFRIYSDLLPGRGGPEREERWVGKFERAQGRMMCSTGGEEGAGSDVEAVGGYLSDEEDVGEEEWRKVRANDKELRRYLIWRWGLEGITYDINNGPLITRSNDLRRLSWMLQDETINNV